MRQSDGRPLIQLRDVVKRFKTGAGDVTILKQINMDIVEGEFVSVVGPSGSGKSTLLNMITGIDRPTEGQVIVDGQSVHELNENQLARWRGRHVGIVFQFYQLLPALTILENVMLPMDFCGVYRRRERMSKAIRLLEHVGIPDHIHKLPNALSGGEQQRAAIARALANDPPLVVADEPTGNLDVESASAMLSLFQTLSEEGKTLLIVTHDQSLTARTPRVLHIVDGRIHRDEDAGGRD